MTWTPDAIKSLRSRLDLSQAALAATIGATVGAVSRWEQGTRQPTGLYAAALDRIAADDRPRLSMSLTAAADAADVEAAAAIADGQPEAAAGFQRIAGHMRRLAYTHRAAAAYQGKPALDPPQVE